MIGGILARRRALPQPPAWRLRGLAVCASTETELERWLEREPPAAALRQARVVAAATMDASLN